MSDNDSIHFSPFGSSKAYRIPSARKIGHDYSSPGYYFSTVCTLNRTQYFGNHPVETPYRASPDLLKSIIESIWAPIPNHCPTVECDAFVVMPNHLHGIIKLKPGNTTPVGQIVNLFKGAASREIRKLDPYFGWQSRFHGIILNQEELWAARNYIQNNPHVEQLTSQEDLKWFISKIRKTVEDAL